MLRVIRRAIYTQLFLFTLLFSFFLEGGGTLKKAHAAAQTPGQKKTRTTTWAESAFGIKL